MIEALQAATGPLIAAVIAFLGIVYTQRQAKAAQKVQKSIEEKQVDAEAYMRARQFDDIALKRMETEASEALARSTRLESELVALRQQQTADRERHDNELRAKDITLANMQDDWRQTLQLHAAWDMLALQRLQDELPEPPPLYPPAHVRRARVEGEDGTIES